MKTICFVAACDVRINQKIAVGLAKALYLQGQWHLHMYDWTAASIKPHTLNEALRTVRPDALVTHAGGFEPGSLEVLRALSIPWVVVGYDYLPQVPVPAVLPDNKAVGTMAAEYLLARRFKHLAMANFPGTADLPRSEAFRACIARNGCTLHEFIMRDRHRGERWPGTASVNWTERALVRWLRRLPKPCAVFAYSDHPAAHVIGVCARHGIRVPEEVSVLGVDDDELLCHSVYPNLASVHVPNARMGAEAARLILDWTPGRRVIPIAPQTVVERDSVRSPQIGDPLVDKAIDHLYSHVADGVRVRDLQKLTGLTPQMLVYRFRAAIRSTPMEEILRCRVARARQMLTETDETVSAISSQCGFNSATQFYVTFHNQTGMSPREYRVHYAP